MNKIICFVLIFIIGYSASYAADNPAPAELKRLLMAGEELFDFRKADLNGDGLMDYVFIVTQPKANNNDDCAEGDNRVLKIAIRSFDKHLNTVKSNKNIILCKEAGGVFGDPYYGMDAGKKWFSVHHAGGSSTRWYNDFLFRYSGIDQTWQLVKALEGQKAPDKLAEDHYYKPPKDYGKIDIADFDPGDYKDKGIR